jgi:UDP-3-O-[3-hydroxymyristoyl] glucosamine N-acyltransferase
MPGVSHRLSAITAALGGQLHGTDGVVQRLAPLETATGADLAFVSHARYAKLLETTHAGALIVPPALRDAALARGPCIVTDDVYHYFALLTQWWKRSMAAASEASIHPTACIASSAVVGQGVRIGPFVVVGQGAVVGDGARLDAHVVLEDGAQVGAQSHLHARVVVGERCRVGQRCILHSGVVIGADGFGFAPHQGTWVKIEQLGAVRIGDDVEMGANTCVDRGALDDTVIEDGVKLDNLVQIGHNVHVGAHTAMAGCAGVAGSARIGAHCTVGGGAVVLGHLELADHVHVSAASVVMRSLRKAGQYSGVFPIDDNAAWEKNAATLRQLHALRERIKQLEKSNQQP